MYTQTLKTEGYKLNEYEKFVANKTINEKQCTGVWYVEDNKALHVDSKVLDNLVEIIIKIGEITITRGKKNAVLGINI